MPVTRQICPHAWTFSGDVTKVLTESGRNVTHTFSVFVCSLCGERLERENPINA